MEQLVEAFHALPIGQLTPSVIGEMGIGQGVYQLFLDGKLMYIGKADKNIRKRLERHYRMLSARQNIDMDTLGFKALYAHMNWISVLNNKAVAKVLSNIAPGNEV